MKKTLIAFLCTFIALPAVADNYIKFKASAIEDTINTMVPESHRVAAADEYQKQMDSTTGKISVMGIYKVCAAAGFNINNTNGYNGCRLFINTIAEKSGFGSGSANQQNCKTKFSGIWSLSSDGKQYQCVGKDGHKLVYHASCNGAGGDCIRDFSSLQTQEPNAREFILAYGQQKNLQFTCWYTFDKSRWQINNPRPQDYIKCSAGGKAYEFEFDDLIQDPGKTAVESENTALCEMFGGKIVKHPDSSIEKQWQSCEVSREICNGPLHNLAVKIGHNVMYQGYCRLSRTAKETSVVGLKTLPGVDSRVFYNTGAQMRAGMAKQQTEEYLRTKFPNETYVNCDPNPKILKEGFGIDRDYVMTCTVGSKQVDFIFHDLTEGNDGRAATGMDAMQCIISGGTFKGESCRGPTQAECNALDAALRAKGSSEGAKWDDDVRACIMGNAMKTYKRDVATGYIVGAVVIIGGTIAVIGTGGAAAPAIIGGAEMLVTDLAINWAIDANHRRLSQGAATRFVNFVEDADKCTTEACALKVLQSHYATLSGVMNDLNKDDLAVVDATMERLFGLIQTEFVACGKNDKGQTVYANPADCAMQQSHLKIMDYIDPVSEPVLIIGSILYNPGYVASKFMKIKNVSKLAKLDDSTRITRVVNPKKAKNVAIGFIDESKFLNRDVSIEDYIEILKKEGYNVELHSTNIGINPMIRDEVEVRTFQISKYTDETDVAKLELDFIKNASDIDKNYRQGFVALKYNDIVKNNPDSWYNTYKTILEDYSSQDADIVYAKENWGKMSVEDKKKFITETNQKYRNLICENPKECVINWDKAKSIGGDASYDSQRLGINKKSENDIVSDVYSYSTPQSSPRRPDEDFTKTLRNIVHENIHYGQDVGKSDIPTYLLEYNDENYINPMNVPESQKFLGITPAYNLQPLEIEAKGRDARIVTGILEKM